MDLKKKKERKKERSIRSKSILWIETLDQQFNRIPGGRHHRLSVRVIVLDCSSDIYGASPEGHVWAGVQWRNGVYLEQRRQLYQRWLRGILGDSGDGWEEGCGRCVCVSLSLSRGDMSRKETRGGPHRGDKLRQHPRTRLLLRFWNASPSLPPPPRHSRAIPFSGYGAMCCWRDDIREIERRVKYLWPNQMRGRGQALTKAEKSWLRTIPGQIFPSLLRFIAASFAFVYCMIKMYGEFVEELKDRIEGFFILDIIKWLTFFVELCLY